jgi:hypothetical protein
MGRIRKTLAWTFSPGGNMKGPIRAESSAERAAREQAELLREQNRLLAGGTRSRPRPASRDAMTCCLDCINQGCDTRMVGEVNWTRSASRCDCPLHHQD